MKLLTREETQGLDSTSKTINKWKEFFQTALPNLGYRDSLLETMYPYSKGIPMIDGSYMPVSEVTGRAFFQLSLADKLAQVLSVFTYYNSTCRIFPQVRKFLASLWVEDFKYLKIFFEDATEEEFETLKQEVRSQYDNSGLGDPALSPVFHKYWKIFVDNSKIHIIGIQNSSAEYSDVGEIDPNIKDRLASQLTSDISSEKTITQGSCAYIYCSLLENSYEKLPQELCIDLVDKAAGDSSGAASRIRSFAEVYLQDYLVLSLNPIDKFMCSTKQAFSSCMSISKQNEVTGTNSTPAFGLPAIFPSDSVFMLFLTPGKHKNMYWESDEWRKLPSERNPEKAYKYLKMTCRALTYKGTPQKAVKDFIEDIRNTQKKYKLRKEDEALRNLSKVVDAYDITNERLYVGRQYSARGEDFVWQVIIELLLAQFGVSTSMAYANQTDTLKKAIDEVYKHELPLGYRLCQSSVSSCISGVSRKHYLRRGEMNDCRVAAIDRYGYVRGIYYDNLQLYFRQEVIHCRDHSGRMFVPSKEMYEMDYPITPLSDINVGTSRYGTCGITWFSPMSGLDMFKVMSGEQSYNYLNSYVKICHHCKKVIVDESASVSYNGNKICSHCAEELQLKTCPCCDVTYSAINKEEAAEHEQYNIMEFVNPKNYEYLPPKYVCKSQLKLASTGGGSSTAICAHCGTVMGRASTNDRSLRRRMDPIFPSLTVQGEFKGFNIFVQLCNFCLRKAVMCDKCHRLIFLDSITDACLLLPNRRVICPDCVDSIRLQKDKRNHYNEVLSFLRFDPDQQQSDSTHSGSEGPDLETAIAEKAEELGYLSDRGQKTITKDVRKQIRSYLQGHPDEGAPALKSSNIPFPEEVAPVSEEV